jgi:hypothetical protein
MKNIDKSNSLLIAFIGFLFVLVGYIFYLGIFPSFELTDNSGIKSANQIQSENNYLTSNFMDDFFMSLLLDEGIVTQRGLGVHNQVSTEAISNSIMNNNERNNHQDVNMQRLEQHFKMKNISSINYTAPERIPRSHRFQITLERADAYPNLKPYLEANNLPDTLRVMKIHDNTKKKTLLILSIEPIG